MLTGSRAFGGDDVAETLATVIKNDPAWDRVPFHVRRLLESCLEKDVKRRLRDIADAWRLLDAAPRDAGRGTSKTAHMIWPGAVALLLVSTISIAVLHFREPRLNNPMLQFTVPAPE